MRSTLITVTSGVNLLTANVAFIAEPVWFSSPSKTTSTMYVPLAKPLGMLTLLPVRL